MTKSSRVFFSEWAGRPRPFGLLDAPRPETGVNGRSTIRKEENRVSDTASREIAYNHFHITYVTYCPMQEDVTSLASAM